MKTCSKCKEDKEPTEFHKNRCMKDGLAHVCKSCKKNIAKEHRSRHPKKHQERQRAWKEANKEHVSLYEKNYRQLNRGKFRSYQAKRRSRMALNNMETQERQKVEYLYWLAKDLEMITGEPYHVDHIKPLSKGGEHKLANLQILPSDLNLKKGARYEEST